MSSKARGWRKCGCYVWRTRKPSAPIGLPLIGRHFAYVGKTSSRWHRDAQHMERQPWSDLEPKVYALWVPFPHWNWTRSLFERLYTWLLLPVYPVQFNQANPRRISKNTAEWQRGARDANGKTIPALVRMAVRWIFFSAFISLAVYVLFRWGK